MIKLILSLALAVAVITTATLGLLHFRAAQVAVEHTLSPGELSPKHAFLADRCESCHEPMVGVTVVNCTACHATSEYLLGRQPTAFHASVAECATCHLEHRHASIRPLVMDHIELARLGARTLARASRTDADSAATLKSLETCYGFEAPNNSTHLPRGKPSTAPVVTIAGIRTSNTSEAIARNAMPSRLGG